MATITIDEFKGTRSVTLTAARVRMVEDEIRRVRGGWVSQLLAQLTAPAVRMYPTSPDCLIRVDDGGRTTTYEVHGRYHLKKAGEKYFRAFYMGLLVIEWLYQ